MIIDLFICLCILCIILFIYQLSYEWIIYISFIMFTIYLFTIISPYKLIPLF